MKWWSNTSVPFWFCLLCGQSGLNSMNFATLRRHGRYTNSSGSCPFWGEVLNRTVFWGVEMMMVTWYSFLDICCGLIHGSHLNQNLIYKREKKNGASITRQPRLRNAQDIGNHHHSNCLWHGCKIRVPTKKRNNTSSYVVWGIICGPF